MDEGTEKIDEMDDRLRREVEERREIEKALSESEQRYRALIEQAVEGIWVGDAETHEIVDANPAFCEYVGYSREELLGMKIDQFLDRSPEEIEGYLAKIRKEGSLPPTEGRWLTREGEVVQVQITSSLIRRPDRELICTIGRDIREKKRLEAQLELTDRLASIGTLASGIAHELNNPLAYILTNLHFLEAELERLQETGGDPDFEEWKEVLEQSRRGADRMQQIVGDLRSFYRSGEHRIELLDVQTVLEAVKGLAMSELPTDAEIIEEYDEAPTIEANRSALEQAFLNILVNAVQALPEEPAEDGSPQRITIRTSETEGGGACVEISDTGVGIDEKDLGRIFEPFFTTKPVNAGTGLGLSMAHSIIHSFGGEILVDSEVGEGSTFRIELPPPSESEVSAESVAFLD